MATKQIVECGWGAYHGPHEHPGLDNTTCPGLRRERDDVAMKHVHRYGCIECGQLLDNPEYWMFEVAGRKDFGRILHITGRGTPRQLTMRTYHRSLCGVNFWIGQMYGGVDNKLTAVDLKRPGLCSNCQRVFKVVQQEQQESNQTPTKPSR